MSDPSDSLPCFPRALMDNYPPGADWVDWQESRAYGATTNFATWYVRALRRFAALHAEFAGSFGDAAKAENYTRTANAVTESVRTKLWLPGPANVSNWERDGAHFATNARHDHDCGESVMDDGWWVDDQLWAVVNGVATAEQSTTIKGWLANRTANYEGMPTRWSSKGPAADHGRYGETWFGRLGLGDVLMRYNNFSQPEFGLTLLRRIASAFAASGNIDESYHMDGSVGGDQGTDYLEHCGGFVWAMIDGPFGVSFDSDAEAAATIEPQLGSWPAASAHVVVRGVNVSITGAKGQAATLKAVASTEASSGQKVTLRLVQHGKAELVTVASP